MYYEIDKYNSEIFGIKMANIILEKDEIISEEKYAFFEKECFNNNIEHISVKVSTREKNIFNFLIHKDYILVDTIVEYLLSQKSRFPSNIHHKCIIRDCTDKDLKDIMYIAYNSFKIDRFHSDFNLDRESCNRYYEKWIKNSYNGFADRIIVAEYNDEVIGFTTFKYFSSDNFARGVLSAVSDKYRKLGAYTSMLYEGIYWIINHNSDLKGIFVGTQIDNIAVQKVWSKLGFSMYDSHYVLHKKI